MHYTPHIYKSAYTFDDILSNTKKWFASLPESKQKSLKELNRRENMIKTMLSLRDFLNMP